MSTITTSRHAESSAPLDVLLVDAALGPLRRFVMREGIAPRRAR